MLLDVDGEDDEDAELGPGWLENSRRVGAGLVRFWV